MSRDEVEKYFEVRFFSLAFMAIGIFAVCIFFFFFFASRGQYVYAIAIIALAVVVFLVALELYRYARSLKKSEKAGKAIQEWQEKDWRLHSYAVASSPTTVNNYLLFEKSE